MLRVPRSPWVAALLIMLMLLIFAIDTLAPLDMASAVLYVIVVLVAASLWQRRGVLLISAGCGALSVLSYLLTHLEVFSGAATGRLTIGLLAIGITCWLVLRSQAATLALLAREEALRRSEAFLAETQSISKTGSFSFSVPGGEMYWSAQAARIYGYPLDVVPNVARILAHTAPEDQHMVRAAIEQSLRCEGEVDLRHRLRMADGELKYVHVRSIPSTSKDGACEYLGALTDVTAAVMAEQALHRSQVELAHATRVTMLGELAASIAHEVTQPLAAISNNSEACLRWLGRPVPEFDEAKSCIGNILGATTRAAGVIQRIRTLARRSEPEHAALDLNTLIEESIDMLQRELNQHKVMLTLNLAAGLAPAYGDAIQLQQVVINLLMNATQAIGINPSRQPALVVRSELSAAATLQVSVSDSGPGIPASVLPRLFEPFYSTKVEGMGMGLAISGSIIEAHGGRIWAEAGAAAGATLCFTLPVHAPA